MEPDLSQSLVTALNALAIVLSISALAVSALAWFFSRAHKVREFESRVYGQLTNAASRIEAVESAMQQHKLEVTGLCDEMLDAADKAGKARRRIYAENQRAAERDGGGEVLDPNADRAAVLRQVKLRLAGS